MFLLAIKNYYCHKSELKKKLLAKFLKYCNWFHFIIISIICNCRERFYQCELWLRNDLWSDASSGSTLRSHVTLILEYTSVFYCTNISIIYSFKLSGKFRIISKFPLKFFNNSVGHIDNVTWEKILLCNYKVLNVLVFF